MDRKCQVCKYRIKCMNDIQRMKDWRKKNADKVRIARRIRYLETGK